MATTVHVKNIGAETTEQEIRDFFSFCGRISKLSVTPESGDKESTQSASVTFEKETAAKTALLLDNTQLGKSLVHVSSAQSLDELSKDRDASGHDEELQQEDKPRSRVVAELLAHGYVIGDQAIDRALKLDQQHGISTRFTNALQQFDQRFKATETAQGLDQKYNITERAQQGFSSLYSYFDKAQGTPTGQRLRSFYDVGQKQVLDVHNEARHLASLKQNKQSPSAGEQASQAANTVSEKASEAYNSASQTASQVASDAQKTANQAANTVSEKANEAAAKANDATKS